MYYNEVLVRYTWDPKKAKSNLKKHGVSFEEGKTILDRPGTLVVHDSEGSSEGEDRFVSLGMSIELNMLVVVHCERDGNEFRIISARRAEKHEVKKWQERK